MSMTPLNRGRDDSMFSGSNGQPRSLQSMATHIEEFGEIDRIIHVSRRSFSITTDDADGDDDDVPNRSSTPSLKFKRRLPPSHRHRASRFLHSLFRRRQLMQYFYNDILFRSRSMRHLSREELFLDLVLVASTASLGHHLRESITWMNVQIFLLLYMAIYSAFRQVVFSWNLWGVKDDVLEKLGIYLTFVCITGIAIGSLDPFSDHLRPYVAASAFLATFIPLFGNAIWAAKEPLLRVHGNRVNQIHLGISISMLSIMPYLAAAFVSTDRTARMLFWAAVAAQPLGIVLPVAIYHFLHRNVENHSRIAFDIGHLVEKFEVLTMIVLGESVISLLFEGGDLVLQENVRISRVYLMAFGSSAMLYSFQTLYMQVDSLIPRGGIHALRYDQYFGMAWASLHVPYHMFLMLFASGLGIGTRDIVIQSLEKGVLTSLRAEDVEGGEHFTPSARWVYAISWGGALITSGLIGLTHKGGPRTVTKRWRLLIRFCISIGVSIGVPFTNLKAGLFHMVFALTTMLLATVEFILAKADKVGLFSITKASSPAKQSDKSGSCLSTSQSSSSDEDGDEDEDDDDIIGDEQVVEEPVDEIDWDAEGISRDEEGQPQGIAKTLTMRMQRGTSSRLVAVRRKRKRKIRNRKGLG